MLEQRKLDDSSYDANYEKAIEKLKSKAPWWEHLEASDPGVTLLELYSLLNDMQSYYMDMMQESHYRKYLKLLALERDMGGPASTWVCLDNIREDMRLPEGTRFLAENMVFETVQEELLSGNRITALYMGGEQEPLNLSEQMDMRRKFSYPLNESGQAGNCLFTVLLAKPVAAGERIGIHITVDERSGRNRPAGKDFRMAGLVWEYYNGKSWLPAKEAEDTTYGLLYTGRVLLHIHNTMAQKYMEGPEGRVGYPIRCVLAAGCYDVRPVLYKIRLNVIPVRQTNTLCRTAYYDYDGREEACLPLTHYLERTGQAEIYVKKADGLWEDFRSCCEITLPAAEGYPDRCIRISRQRFGRVPPAGREVIKVVSRHPSFYEEYSPVRITGVSTQKLPFRWQSLYRPSVELQLRTGEDSPYFREYRCAEPEEDRHPYVWHFAETEDMIVLGDGRHGEIPAAAADGLCITSLQLCEGQQGNTAYGRIDRLERPELFDGMTCYNPVMAKGGRDRRTAGEQFAALAAVLAEKEQIRAVTAGDYAAIVKGTPGLVIEEAEASLAGDGTVHIRVPLPEAEDGGECRKIYEEAIKNRLVQYRMVTTTVNIEFYVREQAEEMEEEVL